MKSASHKKTSAGRFTLEVLEGVKFPKTVEGGCWELRGVGSGEVVIREDRVFILQDEIPLECMVLMAAHGISVLKALELYTLKCLQ